MFPAGGRRGDVVDCARSGSRPPALSSLRRRLLQRRCEVCGVVCRRWVRCCGGRAAGSCWFGWWWSCCLLLLSPALVAGPRMEGRGVSPRPRCVQRSRSRADGWFLWLCFFVWCSSDPAVVLGVLPAFRRWRRPVVRVVEWWCWVGRLPVCRISVLVCVFPYVLLYSV